MKVKATLAKIDFGRFADSVGVIDNLRFYWTINKTMGYDFNDANIITQSGPHKIFLTYDKPLLDTVNTLALDTMCTYAQNEYIDTVIVKKGVFGVYNEGWGYKPGDSIRPDPLYTLRQHTGQCGSYANLLTCLYRSIGIKANSSIIFNGERISNTTFDFFFVYLIDTTYFGIDSSYICVLSNKLKACNGDDQIWPFNYHAVTYYNNYLCDAVFGLFANEQDYKLWWRYYLHPKYFTGPYSHIEPPPFPPSLFQWVRYIPAFPNSVLPDSIEIARIPFYHH